MTGVALVRERIDQKYVVPGQSGADGVQEYWDGGLLTICALTLATRVSADAENPMKTS